MAIRMPGKDVLAPTQNDHSLSKDPEKAATDTAEPNDLLVTFSESDPGNPKDWNKSRKWTVTAVLSATGFTRIMISTMMAPALGTIAAEFNLNSVEANMALSVYLLATAFGPLLFGPLSEVYGRSPILHISSVWFLVWNIVCGFANSGGLLIAARLLAGLGASAIYALAGGVLGDMYRPDERGRSLGLYLLVPLMAVAVGPIIGGYLTAGASWRWMFWSTSIAQAVMVVAAWFTYRETYAPTILEQRAKLLRKNTGRYYYTATAREHEGRSVLKTIQRSLTRPLRMLILHPIIQINGLISAFYYGVLYIVLTTFSNVWVTEYNESMATSGLHYLAVAFGELAGSQIGGLLMDWSYTKLKTHYNRGDQPEYRIPLILPFAFLAPAGMFLYAWSVHFHLSWPVVDLGIFILSLAMQVAGQPLQAYVIDAYPDHVSSATAATQFLRSLTAFAFPLFAPKLYSALGYGWGNSAIGFVTLAIGVPAPMVVWFCGAKLRAKAESTY